MDCWALRRFSLFFFSGGALFGVFFDALLFGCFFFSLFSGIFLR